MSLVLGEGKDTGDVIAVSGFLLLREIADDMTTM